MAIQGSYRINFTDPKNGSFVIDPYTVNGTVTPTSDILHQKATRANTSLQLPGQYTPNYGELVHEDLVHLLENFAGDREPTNFIEGQVWYDTGDNYTIIDLVTNGAVLDGNHSAAFSEYIADDAVLIAWYGPVSVTDNSYSSIRFKVQSYTVQSPVDSPTVTAINVTGEDGVAMTFPNNVVGGYITVSQASRRGRLKVASVIQGTLQWVDAVSVIVSNLAPRMDNQQDGDLWFDSTTLTLNVSIAGTWKSVTGGYLPLTGGSMAGPIVMGSNPITYVGPVNANNVLANKVYVDTAIAAAIEPLEEGTASGITALTTRVTAVEADVPTRVKKSGDNVSGTLVFGPNGTTSSLNAGVDMNNFPIIKPSITWDPSDYLEAVGETHNVPDKKYIGQVIAQHMLDVVHGGKIFIEDQPNGSGKILDSLFFASTDHTLSWNIVGNSSGIGQVGNALVLYTSELLGAGVEIRKKRDAVGNPLFKVSDQSTRSWNSLYIHDGQPQPLAGGAATDQNEDTKAATKGYVSNAISNLEEATAPVTSATFTFNIADITYPLTLVRSGGENIVVDINHKHSSDRIDHTYVPLVDWSGGYGDLVGDLLGGVTQTTTGVLLTALNSTKAPIKGAKFADPPQVGGVAQVLDINLVNNSFCLVNTTITFPDGYSIIVVTPENVEYSCVISSSISGTDPYGQPATYYLVTPTLPDVEYITKDMVHIKYGAYIAGDDRQLVNLGTVNFNTKAQIAQDVPTIAAPLITAAITAQTPGIVNPLITAAITAQTPGIVNPLITASTNAAKRTIMVKVGDETTAIATGVQHTFRMPHAMILTELRGSLTTAQVSGTIFTVDVKQNGTTVLSTKLTIDNTEKTSKTAAALPVISVPSLVDDGEITIDVTQIGNGTATGLKLVFIGRYS